MSQQINLYEARLRPRHELPTARNLGMATIALLIVLTAFVAGTYFDAERKSETVAVYEKQLAEGQERLAGLSKRAEQDRLSPQISADIAVARSMLNARKEVVGVLDSGKFGNTSGFSAMMSGFARQTQNDLWLTGFSFSAGGEEIEIRGRLLDPGRLPAYVQALSREPVFQGRRFAALEMRSAEAEAKTGEALRGDATGAAKAGVLMPTLSAPSPHVFEFILRSENAATGRDEVKR